MLFSVKLAVKEKLTISFHAFVRVFFITINMQQVPPMMQPVTNQQSTNHIIISLLMSISSINCVIIKRAVSALFRYNCKCCAVTSGKIHYVFQMSLWDWIHIFQLT